MPKVSIITAAYAPGADFLAETIASVEGQQLPPGWELEWIVQEDGESPVLAEAFAAIPYVKYAANQRQLGISGTRNLALDRVSGGLLRVLDSDDVLLPGALSTLVPHFEETSVHWAVGQADDLMTDGRRVKWDPLIPTGFVKAGVVNDYAIAHGGNWPIHCAGLMARTDTVRAIGGWAGTPNDEDIVMFAALSEMADGFNDESVTWLYRQHPNQVTRTERWRAQSEITRRIALHRVNAVRALRMSIGIAALPPLETAGNTEVVVRRALKDREANDYL
ncbi:glycosyltransferase family 2 protein [Actinoplanes sp. CA-030573]|uniref:glycosyltransferase family 2 protein n=1 Tax=Actinoplanes sp. CA-030573 TaxID=3239898 RepID=UPI003D8B4F8B